MSSVCIQLRFSLIAHTFARPKKLINYLPNYKLADEIAEPRPDMSIKVAAFTVSKKSIYNSGEAVRFSTL